MLCETQLRSKERVFLTGIVGRSKLIGVNADESCQGKAPASGRSAKGIVEIDHARTAEFDVKEAPQPEASGCTQGRGGAP